MYHVILRMRNANVNKYGDFGTPSISLERVKLETSYLGVVRVTRPKLEIWDPSVTFKQIKVRAMS